MGCLDTATLVGTAGVDTIARVILSQVGDMISARFATLEDRLPLEHEFCLPLGVGKMASINSRT